MAEKMEYEAPALIEVGSFEEITQQQSCGMNADFTGFVEDGDTITCS